MKIISWNVLHIIHELNYALNSSYVINKYDIANSEANEQKRLVDIFSTIRKHLSDETVICLQEVPGDLLTLLKKLTGMGIFEYQYTRIPKIKNLIKYQHIYSDPAEYLVILIPDKLAQDAKQLQTIQFDDPGKACSVVQIDKMLIMNTHVPMGTAYREKAFEQIGEFVDCTELDFMLVGDMNMCPDKLRDALKVFKTKSKIVEMDKPTRKGINRGVEVCSKIDHGVISSSFNVLHKFVADNVDMSDHSLIGFNIL